MRSPRSNPVLGAGLLALALCCGSCGSDTPSPASANRHEPVATQPEPTAATPPRMAEPARTAEREPAHTRGPAVSDGRPVVARLSIPRLGLAGVRVVPYRGRTDDARGTTIQNAGDTASPYGPNGGVGPGGVGNYQVTGHRLSATEVFRFLPRLGRGDRVLVDARGRRFVYRIVDTRSTSFRSERSLRQQRAAVPGRPGVAPSRAMITLSTCATVEDHAAGNYWADRFDNPEHRIDKIGVLVRTTRG